nr:MAG: hypothetical protein J07AB56_14290 [Candidatus Nanosalinarum sp. J07AB56]
MKAQSSLEFLAFVSLSLTMLAVLSGVVVAEQSEFLSGQQSDTARQVADQVSFELEMALVQGDYYSRVFALPEAIGGVPYSVNATSGALQVSWRNRTVVSSTRFESDAYLSTQGSNVFRVVHNSSGVFLVEA